MYYLPFKIVFAEGINVYGQGMSNEEPQIFNMLPVWFSVSENDNIIFQQI